MPSVLRRRFRWIIVLILLATVIAGGLFWWATHRHLQAWQLLAMVVQIEESSVAEENAQSLGWTLAMLGRDDEVRALDMHPQFELPETELDVDCVEIHRRPWREAIEDIAAEHRIVMIMEDHIASRHREFISETLPMFREAGFTHYAAEALGEMGETLMQRGYPSFQTGVYTPVPQFGNLLRRAIDLEFDIVGYDFRPFSHNEREDYAAEQLTSVLEDSDTKLLVHAGHAHVFKHENPPGMRWLAARLWDKTGIEPFTIWQWSELHDAHDYRAVLPFLMDEQFDEPIVLMPPPAADCGFRNFPKVDAIVVHPPDNSVAPSNRTPLFTEGLTVISGRWEGDVWPVVVSTFAKGEPDTAVPLDQVMLRDSERDFVLWVPESADAELRVFDQSGLLDTRTSGERDVVHIQQE